MILAMKDFDCILWIDILTAYRAIVEFYQKLVQFHLVEGDNLYFYCKGVRPPMPLVFALKHFLLFGVML